MSRSMAESWLTACSESASLAVNIGSSEQSSMKESACSVEAIQEYIIINHVVVVVDIISRCKERE